MGEHAVTSDGTSSPRVLSTRPHKRARTERGPSVGDTGGPSSGSRAPLSTHEKARLVCGCCGREKPKSGFSKKQWKRAFEGNTGAAASNHHGSAAAPVGIPGPTCLDCRKAQQQQQQAQPPSQGPRKTPTRRPQQHEPTSKHCGGCEDSKAREEFSEPQWRHPVDYERFCRDCCQNEVAAKAEHRRLQRLLDRDGTKKKKRCYGCHRPVPPAGFSASQRKKPYGLCAPCVAAVQEDRRESLARALAARTKQCSICGAEKPAGGYGRGQWNRSDPRCTICATEPTRGSGATAVGSSVAAAVPSA